MINPVSNSFSSIQLLGSLPKPQLSMHHVGMLCRVLMEKIHAMAQSILARPIGPVTASVVVTIVILCTALYAINRIQYYFHHKKFMESLNTWLKDESITGEKEIAFKRLVEAFEKGKWVLNLTRLNLSQLPSCIGSLSELASLHLWGNALTSLPPEIGNLSKLENLWLGCSPIERRGHTMIRMLGNSELTIGRTDIDHGNKLTSLPKEIGNLSKLKFLIAPNNNLDALPRTMGQLVELKELDLRNNKFPSIPSTIGKLPALEELFLDKNKLTDIPTGITQLSSLQWLSLSNNNLASLPPDMGDLLDLTEFCFHDNPNLSELPLSLGQIPGLSYLDNTGTGVSDELCDEILTLCEAKRIEVTPFSERLSGWLAHGEHQMDLTMFDQFDDGQKKKINEWLFRLEKTDDYRGCQKKLAKVVCGMLETLVDNKEFQTDFFPQVHVNNEECHDHAGMAINELYTYWRILTYKEATTEEKVSFMIQGAKTITLRKILAQKIDDWEQKNKRLKESAEIYLYYETTLRKELDLLTVIERMSFGDIGKRDWIDKEELIEKVNKGYLATLVSTDLLQKLIEKEISFQELWGKEEKEYGNDMDIIDDVTFKDIFTDKEFKNLWIETANKYLEEKITDYDQGTYLKVVDIMKEQKEQAKQKRMTEWISRIKN